MRRGIASLAIAALIVPGGGGAATARQSAPPVGPHWEHIATYQDEPLCAATGRIGVERGDWVDYDCVFNDEYDAWDLHVRLTAR